MPATSLTEMYFRETAPHSVYGKHTAPQRNYVLTLRGTLEFTTSLDHVFTLKPGDVLLAEDVSGHGHSWKMLGDDPWVRAYRNELVSTIPEKTSSDQTGESSIHLDGAHEVLHFHLKRQRAQQFQGPRNILFLWTNTTVPSKPYTIIPLASRGSSRNDHEPVTQEFDRFLKGFLGRGCPV